MLDRCILSLCIPTNGIIEWVVPVLDSIYSQEFNEDLYEVCICDNGSDAEFEKVVRNYMANHSNLVYKKSNAEGFLNQIEAFQMAKGEFVKFVNHRLRFVPGSLQMLYQQIESQRDEKLPIFFSNHVLERKQRIYHVDTFDEYVAKLSYHSSWSGGLGFWNDENAKELAIKEHNTFFPHIEYVYNCKDADAYIVDDRKIVEPVDDGHTRKGHYNLFMAFAVEYPRIFEKLLQDRLITYDTYNKIMGELKGFLVQLYAQFIIRKEPSSYELDDNEKHLSVYYDVNDIKRRAYLCAIKQQIYVLLLGFKKR